MTDNSYQIDADYPARGRRVVNKVGWCERDQYNKLWLSHNKIIIRGVASEKKEEERDE